MSEMSMSEDNVPETPEGPDYETEARAQGWVPEDEWKGDDKPEFVDAKTFLDRGKKIDNIFKSKLTKAEQEIENLKNANAEFKQFHDKALAKERKEHARLVAELEAKSKQAITEGDGDAWEEAQRELKTLEPPTQQVVEDARAQAWVQRNSSWYNVDPDLTATANGYGPMLEARGFMGDAFWNELDRKIREAHPEKFKTESKPPVVEGGTVSEQSEPKPRSFDALDKEGKAAFERFFNSGFYGKDIEKAKKEYAKNYDWD